LKSRSELTRPVRQVFFHRIPVSQGAVAPKNRIGRCVMARTEAVKRLDSVQDTLNGLKQEVNVTGMVLGQVQPYGHDPRQTKELMQGQVAMLQTWMNSLKARVDALV